ncbi:MAG: hypothetical protein ACOCV3_00760 [Halanaerobiales bacterium]
MDLKERFNYDQDRGILFIDFSNLTLDKTKQIEEINLIIEDLLGDLGHKVYSVVNYDNCKISQEIKDEYGEMMKENQKKYSLGTVRYSNKSFTRTTLTISSVKNRFSSNVCSSKEEAINKIEELKEN